MLFLRRVFTDFEGFSCSLLGFIGFFLVLLSFNENVGAISS